MAQESTLPEPANGIVFPVDDNGRRSSLATNAHIFAAAIERIDPATAVAIRENPKWRSTYPDYVRRVVAHGIAAGENATQIARDGLAAAYDQFWFMREGVERPLAEAMRSFTSPPFYKAHIRGRAGDRPRELAIPYHGEMLHGQALLAQIAQWEAQGIVEPSHAHALRSVQAHPEWLDLSDQTVVLLGAAAEMGPLHVLARWRANLVAIDLPNPAVWQALIATARDANGTLQFPLRVRPEDSMDDAEMAAHAGADLLTETPEIAAWLATLPGPLVVGSYAYLDGEKHVRVSMAMDAIVSRLLAARKDVTLAYLLTPTDVYAVPEDAAAMAQARFEAWKDARVVSNPKLWQESLHLLSGGRFFQPNVPQLTTALTGRQYGIVDCLVLQQGVNYALAKRLQQWRAVVARDAGTRVSCNVAPATTTRSVVKNSALAAAYAGAARFEVEIFHPETSNAVMAALLVYDLRAEESAANPAVALANPQELFMAGANHNGLWRTGFASRSVMEIAAVLGWRAFFSSP